MRSRRRVAADVCWSGEKLRVSFRTDDLFLFFCLERQRPAREPAERLIQAERKSRIRLFYRPRVSPSIRCEAFLVFFFSQLRNPTASYLSARLSCPPTPLHFTLSTSSQKHTHSHNPNPPCILLGKRRLYLVTITNVAFR